MSATSSEQHARPSNAALGLAIFGATILIVQGAFEVLQGIALLVDDGQFAARDDYVYALNTTTWGWIQIILGVLAVAVGLGILARAEWAIVVGIIVVAFSAITSFALIPFYPAWALAVIALDVAVVWALCTLMQSQRPD